MAPDLPTDSAEEPEYIPKDASLHRGSNEIDQQLEGGPACILGAELDTGDPPLHRQSPPFGVYRGNAAGLVDQGGGPHTLVFVPTGRILATMRKEAHYKALAYELARLWVRWGGSEPVEDSAPLLQRFQREDV